MQECSDRLFIYRTKWRRRSWPKKCVCLCPSLLLDIVDEQSWQAMKTQLARLAQQRYELFDGLPRAFRSATEEMSFEEENRKIVQLLTSHGGIEYCEEELHEWIKVRWT